MMKSLALVFALGLTAGCAGLKVSAGGLDFTAKTQVVGVSVNLSKDGKLLGGIAPYISLSEIGGLLGGLFGSAQPTP